MNKNKSIVLVVVVGLIIVSTFALFAISSRQNKGNYAYNIYDKNGRLVSYEQMYKDFSDADLCLFGEIHDDPISHWLERKILSHLYESKQGKLLFGGEMLESDHQELINEYAVYDFYDLGVLERNSNQWDNFVSDYGKLLEFCKEKKIPIVCTNVPNRYAKMVSEKGDSVLFSLNSVSKSFLPELPIKFSFSEKIYKECAEIAKNGAMAAIRKSTVENIVKAQALKDATMAHFIEKNLKLGYVFFHINGEQHSAFHSGICHYLKSRHKVKTISVLSLPAGSVPKADQLRADYIVVVDSDLVSHY